MSKLEKARKKRNKLLGQIEAFKKAGNENRSKKERIKRNKKFSRMVDDLAAAQERVKQLEIIYSAKQQRDQEEEFAVRRQPNNGGGDLKFRKATWNDPVRDDSKTPSTKEMLKRDALVFQRFEDFESLNTKEKIKAHRMYAGERLFFRYIAAGASNDKLRLSQAELDLFHEFQDRAQATTAKIGTDGDGGYLVPTVTEAAIVHQMAFIGPFAGPASGAGKWQQYAAGEKREINVNTSRKTAKAKYVAEGVDIVAQKAAWSQVDLNFHTISNLMPWTIQIQQDSASNLEMELRAEMAESFGRLLNEELTATGTGASPNFLNSVGNSLLAGQTVTTLNSFDNNTKTASPVAYTVQGSNVRPQEIVRAKYSIDKAYRGAPGFAMHASDFVMMTLEQVVDADGRFLYHRPQEGGPLMVHGMRAITNNGYEAAAAGKLCSTIGDFNKFRVGTVRGMYMTVFRELFMQSLQLGLMAYWRVGSVMEDANALAGIKFKA